MELQGCFARPLFANCKFLPKFLFLFRSHGILFFTYYKYHHSLQENPVVLAGSEKSISEGLSFTGQVRESLRSYFPRAENAISRIEIVSRAETFTRRSQKKRSNPSERKFQ
jgi:hypothetical protein